MDAYPYQPDLDERTAIGLAIEDLLDGLAWKPGATPLTVFGTPAEAEAERDRWPAVAVTVEGAWEDVGQPVEWKGSRQGRFLLMRDAEFAGTVTLDVFATDSEMLGTVVRLLREAGMEHPFTSSSYGRNVDVLRYFGGAAKARLSPEAPEYGELPEDVQVRDRNATVRMGVRMACLRLVDIGDLTTVTTRTDVA